ncbi:unnamed protein product, partial [Amoebophrya sp. A25]
CNDGSWSGTATGGASLPLLGEAAEHEPTPRLQPLLLSSSSSSTSTSSEQELDHSRSVDCDFLFDDQKTATGTAMLMSGATPPWEQHHVVQPSSTSSLAAHDEYYKALTSGFVKSSTKSDSSSSSSVGQKERKRRAGCLARKRRVEEDVLEVLAQMEDDHTHVHERWESEDSTTRVSVQVSSCTPNKLGSSCTRHTKTTKEKGIDERSTEHARRESGGGFMTERINLGLQHDSMDEQDFSSRSAYLQEGQGPQTQAQKTSGKARFLIARHCVYGFFNLHTSIADHIFFGWR